MIYPITKAFVLLFMLGIYILFLITLAAAQYAGGWVVIKVDRFEEGTAEVILLSALLPIATYVVFREVATTVREIRRRKTHRR